MNKKEEYIDQFTITLEEYNRVVKQAEKRGYQKGWRAGLKRGLKLNEIHKTKSR